jgi:ferredoxin
MTPGDELELEVTDGCHGCGVCVEECPRGALAMRPVDGSVRAVLDRARCDSCRVCLEVCPVEAILERYPPSWRDGPTGRGTG